MMIESLTTLGEGPLGSCLKGFRGNVYRSCHHYRSGGGYITGNMATFKLTSALWKWMEMVEGNMGEIF